MKVASTHSSETAPPRWIIVAHPDRPGFLDELAWRYRQAPWVEVLADRRRGERRRQQELRGADLRLRERRGVQGDPTRMPAYRLVRQGEGFAVYEATGSAPARCEECGAAVTFEMPRSGEPPARLDVRVVHELISPNSQRARHAVELLLSGPGGRQLLASRIHARTRDVA